MPPCCKQFCISLVWEFLLSSYSDLCTSPRLWLKESNITTSSAQNSCPVKCCIRLTVCWADLDAALRCLMAIKYVRRTIKHFFCLRCCCALLGEMLGSLDHSIELARLAHAQLTLFTFTLTPKFGIHWGHSSGSPEMMDGLLYSFDYPDESSTEHGRVKASSVLLGEMLCAAR